MIPFLIQVIDSAHCKMPDYYIYKVPTCACGDDPVQIPPERRFVLLHVLLTQYVQVI